MIQLQYSIALQYEITSATSDFVFNIHAAKTPQQEVLNETLRINQDVTPNVYEGITYGTRFLQLNANPGLLTIEYEATVSIEHHTEQPERIVEHVVKDLPRNVLPYIYPSRYCQSDRLHRFATREFGHLPQGYGRVQSIERWVRERTSFRIGTSNVSTSAVDILIDQVGVCRDFAHLMIALCRAVNIPARFVTGIDYGADPSLGPTDFHAYVEVYLGNRWYLFDPTGISPPMGLVRIGTGRDAADVSFATMFGTILTSMPIVRIDAIVDTERGFVLPQHVSHGLSSAEHA